MVDGWWRREVSVKSLRRSVGFVKMMGYEVRVEEENERFSRSCGKELCFDG